MLKNSYQNLYSYKTIFILETYASLDDLWSYFIFRLNLEQSEFTYDRFARLYNILSEYKNSFSLSPVILTLKESPIQFYITIDTKNKLFLKEFISRLIHLNYKYTYENSILEYSIDKKNNLITTNKIKNKSYNYDFITQSDLNDMSDTLEKMQEKNYEKLNIPLTLDEINEYRTTFSYYSSHLRYYSELSNVNNIVAELSVVLSLYSCECLKAGNDMRILLKSFLNNLSYWQDKLFIHGSEKIDFMDTSLKADLSQIKISLNLYDEIDESCNVSLDDIFDF